MMRLLVIVGIVASLLLKESTQNEEEENCNCVPTADCIEPYYEQVSTQCGEDDEVCCVRRDVTNLGCGLYTPFGDRVSAGTQIGEFPWVTVIRDTNDKFLGTGTLIHPGAILTTASTVRGKVEDELRVFINARDFIASDDDVQRGVYKIISHKNYDPTYLSNDVALLILKQHVDLDDTIRPLCLPNQDQRFEQRSCIFAQRDNSKPPEERELEKSNQYVLPKDQCQEDVKKNVNFPFWTHLHSSFMCTIGEMPNDIATKGDAGSPLFCEIPDFKDHYALVGMASWRVSNTGPSVFTNVARYRDWIDDYLARLNDGLSNYRL